MIGSRSGESIGTVRRGRDNAGTSLQSTIGLERPLSLAFGFTYNASPGLSSSNEMQYCIAHEYAGPVRAILESVLLVHPNFLFLPLLAFDGLVTFQMKIQGLAKKSETFDFLHVLMAVKQREVSKKETPRILGMRHSAWSSRTADGHSPLSTTMEPNEGNNNKNSPVF